MGGKQFGTGKRALVVWFLMSCYWAATLVNTLRYLAAVNRDLNFDYYAVYLYWEQFLNLPVRLADNLFRFSAIASTVAFQDAAAARPPLSTVLVVFSEIIVLDFALGSAFWLLLLHAIFMRRDPHSRQTNSN